MGHISEALLLLLLLLTSYLALSRGQALNVCEYFFLSSSVSSHCFSLLVILRDEANIQAENGVETALKYLAGNNMTNINKRSMVTLSGEPVNAARDSEYLT